MQDHHALSNYYGSRGFLRCSLNQQDGFFSARDSHGFIDTPNPIRKKDSLLSCLYRIYHESLVRWVVINPNPHNNPHHAQPPIYLCPCVQQKASLLPRRSRQPATKQKTNVSVVFRHYSPQPRKQKKIYHSLGKRLKKKIITMVSSL